MKLAIMQPYLFPYIGYFQLINSVDTFVSADDYQFIQNGWINRNNILVNGQAKMITFSLKKDSRRKNINERYYNMTSEEVERIRKTIEVNYSKAKYFKEVMELIDKILVYPDLNVAKFNFNSIKLICEYIGIECEFLESHDVPKNTLLKREELVIDICKNLNADIYINPIGGTELYKDEYFKERGIDLLFVKNNVEEYNQHSKAFVKDLSIIDVLMHNGKEGTKELLKQCELIKNNSELIKDEKVI